MTEKTKINKGTTIKFILYFFIRSELCLSTKNGHVAPKCVSANNNIVKIINSVSKFGKKYKIEPYNNGKNIGNLTKNNCLFNLIWLIFFSNNYK